VWHVHMLAPYAYAQDCATIVADLPQNPRKNTVPMHRLLSPEERARDSGLAQVLWDKRCPEEPFNVDLAAEPTAEEDEGTQVPAESALRYPIITAAERQMAFFPQVSLPHYRDPLFLKAAVAKYDKQLELKRRHPNQILVPSYAVDVCWHAHMLNPQAYTHDTESILGKVMNHDDAMNDRTEGSSLLKNWETTQQIWRDELKEEARHGRNASWGSYEGGERTVPRSGQEAQHTRLGGHAGSDPKEHRLVHQHRILRPDAAHHV